MLSRRKDAEFPASRWLGSTVWTFQARKSPGVPFPRLNEGAALAEKFNKRSECAACGEEPGSDLSVCRSW